MMIFRWAEENAEALRQMGRRAREEAFKAGVPVHYMEDSSPDEIIREYPDGRKERIKVGPQERHWRPQ